MHLQARARVAMRPCTAEHSNNTPNLTEEYLVNEMERKRGRGGGAVTLGNNLSSTAQQACGGGRHVVLPAE